MMQAAIYARRSTEEHQAASLDVQVGEAKKFIQRKGWTLAPSHIFVDDAVSRAEFKKRPALLRLLLAAEQRTFDVVVVRDESRLGGDVTRTCLLIQDLLDAGVKLHYYFSDENVVLDDANAKFMVAARNYAAELEREKISQRTHEHLLTKARRGLNVGGRCYGYNNVEVMDGERRKEVRYEINEREAPIVLESYIRYGKGAGLRSIVKDLNGRGVPPPSAGRRGTGSWSVSAVWSMLHRERYRGVLIWNRWEKTYKKGTEVRVLRDAGEWVRVEVPELRIVSDEVWFAAQARMRTLNTSKTKKGGRPHRYLLSGIARCGECGGPLTVINGHAGKASVKMYCCNYHRERGDAVCKNKSRRPVETVDRIVTDWLTKEVLNETFVLMALKELRRRFASRARKATVEVPPLEREAARLKVEIDRLVNALATASEKPDVVMAAIVERRERLSSIEARLRTATEAPREVVNELDRVEAEARKRLRQFEKFLAQKGESGRRVIAAALVGPIKATPVDLPEGRRFRLEAEARVGKLLGTEVSNVASPAGVEPALAT
jgi:site-specific DNA recombinase